MTLNLIIIIVLSYLIGSFPSAIIISKIFFGFDIRTKGSGNMGSTNAFRVLGTKWGIIVQVIDILKGVLAVVIAVNFFQSGITFGNPEILPDNLLIKFIAGFSAICGHIWSVFAGFHGGKGVNTAIGMLLAIAPIDLSVGFIVFGITIFSSGYVSLSSIFAIIAFPLSVLIRYNYFNSSIEGYYLLLCFSILLAILIIYTHRQNIYRLIKGTENRFTNLQIFKFRKNQGSSN
jgi:acyl phosphate:glycerol-3-phosphate acyltransferase